MKDVFQWIIIFLRSVTLEVAKQGDNKLSSLEVLEVGFIGSAEVIEEMLMFLIVAVMGDDYLCNTPEQIAQKQDANS